MSHSTLSAPLGWQGFGVVGGRPFRDHVSPRRASDLLVSRVAPDAGGDVGALGEAGSTDDEAPRVMPSVQTAYGDLTEWEAEVLLITQGLFGAEVTERLAAAEPTIRAQVSRVLVEPGSPGRTQAAVFPYETRLVRPSGR